MGVSELIAHPLWATGTACIAGPLVGRISDNVSKFLAHNGCLLHLWKYYYISRAFLIQGLRVMVLKWKASTYINDWHLGIWPAGISFSQPPFLTCRQAQAFLHFRLLGQRGLSIAKEMEKEEDWRKMEKGHMSSCTVRAMNKSITIKRHYLHCRYHRILSLFW